MKNHLYTGYNNQFKISYTIHKAPKHIVDIVYHVCKNDLEGYSYQYCLKNLLIIPTWQKSKYPINTLNQKINKELDRLYLNVLKFAKKLKLDLKSVNKWLNGSSPITGQCLFGNPTNFTYNELENLTYLLKYSSDKIGCCGMVYHPNYGKYGYPVTLFSDAKLNDLVSIITNLKY